MPSQSRRHSMLWRYVPLGNHFLNDPARRQVPVFIGACLLSLSPWSRISCFVPLIIQYRG